jgi:exopolysaccharide biosynthesis polyprenyl glycosylphosphotransferase
MVGIYRSRRIGSRFGELIDILKATTIATTFLLVTGFIFDMVLIDKTFLFIFWWVSSFMLTLSRLVLHFLLAKVRIRGRNTRQMLIIGTGKRAQKFAYKINNSPELGYHILGFVDDQWEGLKAFNNNTGWKFLGDFGIVQALLKEKVVDEVVVSLPVKSYYSEITSIINLCEEQGIIVRLLSDLFDLKIAKSNVDYVDDIPCLTLHSTPIEHYNLLLKRFLDVVLSSILLVFLSPLMLLVSFLIKLDSTGPVFFTQERMGLNKRRFRLFKFRTMVNNAEQMRNKLNSLNEVAGPVFKIRNDPRLTEVGKILRKTSIDELPQFINVLKGEMSLVGPRPPIPSEVEQYQWKDRRRLSMKPGITCLWQINGRSTVPFEKWMELDREYIDNWSLSLDFKILAKTIPAIIRGSGAS